MTQGHFFRMLSIALLGAIALAFVPQSKADREQSKQTAQNEAPANLEIQAAQEVDQINRGNFAPYQMGQSQTQLEAEASIGR